MRADVSILTRPAGRVLLGSLEAGDVGMDVSILTRPAGRVLRQYPPELPPTRSFNPHPTRGSGATGLNTYTFNNGLWFQSSPDPRVGCYAEQAFAMCITQKFQSSPDPRVGCYQHASGVHHVHGVSILTRPAGRVLQAPHCGQPPDSGVSILTRPAGRVLRPLPADSEAHRLCFNPHPTRGSGATCSALALRRSRPVSILTRPAGRVLPTYIPNNTTLTGFQSSPDPRVGCYWGTGAASGRLGSFNPHPTRGSGATPSLQDHHSFVLVSILTRPAGRVLRASMALCQRLSGSFQSSPDPRVGCYVPIPYTYGGTIQFQSSPDPRVGCYRGLKSR